MEPPKQFLFQEEGDKKFPIQRSMYEFYAPRCKSIEVWSFGMGFCGIESALTESIGCSVKIFDHRPEAVHQFELCNTALKTHKADADAPDWLKKLSKKWILPNKLSLHPVLPASFSGTRTLNDDSVVSFEKVKVERVDFVKVDYKELNCSILYDILTEGYRPGLILVHWDEHPDQYNHTMLCAGHLQNTGYSLIAEKDNWFLYRYNDQCVYETTSWARNDCENPLLEEYKQNIVNALRAGNLQNNPTTTES